MNKKKFTTLEPSAESENDKISRSIDLIVTGPKGGG